MNVLHGANLPALWDGCKFLFGFGSANKAQLLRKPAMLRNAVLLLFLYLGLAYACVISESWLSVTSDAVPFPQNIPYNGSWPLLTRQLNQTLCDIYSSNVVPDFPYYGPLCGIVDGSAYVVYHWKLATYTNYEFVEPLLSESLSPKAFGR